jgi:hypothetical protein
MAVVLVRDKAWWFAIEFGSFFALRLQPSFCQSLSLLPL